MRAALVWDEAMPLGNGLLGALVWGDGGPLRISLDRTDLWDLRPVPEFHSAEYSYKLMRQWDQEGRIDDLHRLYDKPYGYPGPTKIPAGRIELTFDGDPKFQTAALDIPKAMADMHLRDGAGAHACCSCGRTWGSFTLPGGPPASRCSPFAGRITEEAGANKIAPATWPRCGMRRCHTKRRLVDGVSSEGLG